MTTTLRAALAVLMLAGFYLFALAILVGMGVLAVFGFQHGASPLAAKLAIVTIIVAIAFVRALWKVARAKQEPPTGILAKPDQAPALWQIVDELAAAAGTRVPDEIRLVPEVNAAVSEDVRMMGLIGGRRRLYLGVPLLQTMTVAQLRAVIAHELGHYSQQHTRLGAITYRGRAAILTTSRALSGRLFGWFLLQYAKLYLLVASAVNRRQELEADALAVRVAGRTTAQEAIRETPLIGAAWTFYENQYLAAGWEAGYAPTPAGFFEGFGALYAARAEELDEMRQAAPPSEQSRWDSHPSTAARIAAMGQMPDVPASPDDRPASVLVPAFRQAAERVAASSVAFNGRQQVSWEELTAISLLVQEQRTADQVYRSAARLTARQTADLSTVLDIVDAGRAAELVHDLAPGSTEPASAEQLTDAMHLLLRVAAVRSGAAQWRHSWSGAAELVDADGQPLDLTGVATLAVSPQTLDAARARLDEEGIDVGTAVQIDTVATAHGARILGGLANVQVDGAPHDVLILSTGLIFSPCKKKTEGGKLRLAAIVESGSVLELASRYRFLPYEEVTGAKIFKNTPVRAELALHGGGTMDIRELFTGERLTRDSGNVLRGVVAQLAPAPLSAHANG